MLLYNYLRFFFWQQGSIAIWCGKGPQTGSTRWFCLGAILVWQGHGPPWCQWFYQCSLEKITLAGQILVTLSWCRYHFWTILPEGLHCMIMERLPWRNYAFEDIDFPLTLCGWGLDQKDTLTIQHCEESALILWMQLICSLCSLAIKPFLSLTTDWKFLNQLIYRLRIWLYIPFTTG